MDCESVEGDGAGVGAGAGEGLLGSSWASARSWAARKSAANEAAIQIFLVDIEAIQTRSMGGSSAPPEPRRGYIGDIIPSSPNLVIRRTCGGSPSWALRLLVKIEDWPDCAEAVAALPALATQGKMSGANYGRYPDPA